MLQLTIEQVNTLRESLVTQTFESIEYIIGKETLDANELDFLILLLQGGGITKPAGLLKQRFDALTYVRIKAHLSELGIIREERSQNFSPVSATQIRFMCYKSPFISPDTASSLMFNNDYLKLGLSTSQKPVRKRKRDEPSSQPNDELEAMGHELVNIADCYIQDDPENNPPKLALLLSMLKQRNPGKHASLKILYDQDLAALDKNTGPESRIQKIRRVLEKEYETLTLAALLADMGEQLIHYKPAISEDSLAAATTETPPYITSRPYTHTESRHTPFNAAHAPNFSVNTHALLSTQPDYAPSIDDSLAPSRADYLSSSDEPSPASPDNHSDFDFSGWFSSPPGETVNDSTVAYELPYDLQKEFDYNDKFRQSHSVPSLPVSSQPSLNIPGTLYYYAAQEYQDEAQYQNAEGAQHQPPASNQTGLYRVNR